MYKAIPITLGWESLPHQRDEEEAIKRTKMESGGEIPERRESQRRRLKVCVETAQISS